LLRATTPATSELAIEVVFKPTKSMLIAVAGGGSEEVTLRIVVAECVSEPLVPVMLSVELPVVAPVMILSVEVPDVVMETGEKESVAPVGKPVADKFTVPVNPLRAATVTV
jgi:hypothetical protein